MPQLYQVIGRKQVLGFQSNQHSYVVSVGNQHTLESIVHWLPDQPTIHFKSLAKVELQKYFQNPVRDTGLELNTLNSLSCHKGLLFISNTVKVHHYQSQWHWKSMHVYSHLMYPLEKQTGLAVVLNQIESNPTYSTYDVLLVDPHIKKYTNYMNDI